MAYADYTYYAGTYKGTRIPTTSFDAVALKASAYIDMITGNRAKDISPVSNAIKNAMCAVADSMYEARSASNGIASETVGDYSVSYKSNSESENDLYDAAYLFLYPTGLLSAMVGYDRR